MTARRGGVDVVLTAHEFKLLKFFTENADRVLNGECLLRQRHGATTLPYSFARRQSDPQTQAETGQDPTSLNTY